MNVYLACFDIADDSSRDRAGKELLAYGQRVQKSVFEIMVSEADELARIRDRLAPLLTEGDDLRFYRLCADCRGASVGVRSERLATFPAAIVI